jgi:predicted AAA+ superfamily ATPase
LLGSSQLLLQKGLSESLAGRFEVHYLPHWSFSEMNDAFGMSFDDFLWFGGYPGPVELIQDELRWKEYILHSLIETTLMRDILLMTRIDKPALLRNLFDLACSYSGQILSFSKILGQLNDAGNTTTLSNYLKLLEGAGMAKGLEKFSPEKIRQRASIPKFQVFNQGLMSASVQYLKGDVKKDKKLWGRWFESVVGAHLLNLSYNSGFSLFYWRDGNDEVDFVLRKGDKIVALEIKSGRIKSSHGMHSFNTRYPITRTMIVGPGGIPAEDFLRINPEDFF